MKVGPSSVSARRIARFARQPAQPLAGAIAKQGFGEFEIKPAEPIGQAVFAENRKDFPRPIDVPVELRDCR